MAVGVDYVNPSDYPPIVVCFTSTFPDSNDIACEGPSPAFTIPDATPFYANLVNTVTNTRCAYEITLDSVNATASAMIVAQPAAIPVFTPLGLVATIGGLLWFGRRRRIKLKTS